MTIEIDSNDIALVMSHVPMPDVHVTFGNDLQVQARVKGIGVHLGITISAVDGDLEINITEAKAAGIGFFGALRSVVGNGIIAFASGFGEGDVKPLKARKNQRGNIQMTVQGLYFENFTIASGIVSFTVDPRP